MQRVNADVLQLCPCGAQPRAGSAYCCEDCVPNYRGQDTSIDTDNAGMRWWPLPVSDAADMTKPSSR